MSSSVILVIVSRANSFAEGFTETALLSPIVFLPKMVDPYISLASTQFSTL